MKFATLLAVVATTQAAYTLEDTPDDGAASWDENNDEAADEDSSTVLCECIGVANVPAAYAIEQTSTDCGDGSGSETYTCNTDTDADSADDTYTWTDDDFATVLTTAGYSATYGDACENHDAEEDWCAEDNSAYDADADVTSFCDSDFIWCFTNSDCALSQVNTDFAAESASGYDTVEFAQCNSASKVVAALSAALAAAVITM